MSGDRGCRGCDPSLHQHALGISLCKTCARWFPHRLCRTGSVVPAAPRRLCRASWVCLCGVAAAAAARTHQVLCHSVRFTGVKRATASIIPTIEHAITNVVDF